MALRRLLSSAGHVRHVSRWALGNRGAVRVLSTSVKQSLVKPPLQDGAQPLLYQPKQIKEADYKLCKLHPSRPDFGHHLMMTFDAACPDLVGSAAALVDAITPILVKHGCSIVNIKEQQFQPIGATVVWTLAESHFSIHTWPEHHTCVIDFFTCQEHANEICAAVKEDLIDIFGARGNPDSIVESLMLPRGRRMVQANMGEVVGQMHNVLLYDVKAIFDAKSPFQHVRVVDTGASYYGKCLVLDGILQISEVEDSYSPTLIRPLAANNSLKRVLIVGGGDLKVAKYLLKHHGDDVEHITIVDIDEVVTNAVVEHFPNLRLTPEEEKKVEIHFLDAAVWVRAHGVTTQQGMAPAFTGCIVDCTDPAPAGGVSKSLFTPEFYNALAKCLVPGSSVTQQYSHGANLDPHTTEMAAAGYSHLAKELCHQLEYTFPLNIVAGRTPC